MSSIEIKNGMSFDPQDLFFPQEKKKTLAVEPGSLTEGVHQLEKKCEAYKKLATTIILTLTLPANQSVLESCPPELHQTINSWSQQLDRINKGE